MKKYTHAWLALKAVELLQTYKGQFNKERNKRLNNFLDFISKYPSTFVRGAWFPDTVIKDNTRGGHTWKYYLNEKNGKVEKRRPPTHNRCIVHVADRLNDKVSLDTKISDLPDRCEALGQTIRDTILVTNRIPIGDVVSFNDSQIAVLFLMLAHYVCDAHVPVHCDKRDMYKPSKVHPDLEGYWEDEILKYHDVSFQAEQFDLDQHGHLQPKKKKQGYKGSLLDKCDKVLKQKKSRWANVKKADDHWRAFLGKGNNNFWDYLVSVCLVSFQMSLLMFPPDDGNVDYKKVSIMKVARFRDRVKDHSPMILADAINSVALLWLAAWERWELLAGGRR